MFCDYGYFLQEGLLDIFKILFLVCYCISILLFVLGLMVFIYSLGFRNVYFFR